MCHLLLRALVADTTQLCRFNKDQSGEREALQTSKMSDTAVSSLTVNGLLFPASFPLSFLL